MSARRKTAPQHEAVAPPPKNTDPAKAPKFGAGKGDKELVFDVVSMTSAEVEQMKQRTFGTADDAVVGRLLAQLSATADETEVGLASACNYTAAALHGVAPRDALEGLLGVQMVGAHNLAMNFLRRASHADQTFEARLEYSNAANRLMRTYTAQVEALAKYRGKGQQRVTVEHVHVHEGGQAIVGNVNHGGGGVPNGNEQTTPRASDMRRQDAERHAVPELAGRHPAALPDARGPGLRSASREPERLEAREAIFSGD